MDGKVNEIWHLINFLVLGLAFVGLLSDYSGRDFDLPKHFHELPDVRFWQKERGSGDILICVGLALLLYFSLAGGIELLPLNPPAMYAGPILALIGVARIAYVHSRANRQLPDLNQKHRSRISLVAIVTIVFLVGSIVAALYPFMHIYPWKIGPVAGMSSFDRDYWLQDGSDKHNVTLDAGFNGASSTGAEILIWNYSDAEVAFDPGSYEILLYHLWNYHEISVEKPASSGQLVTLAPGEHISIRVDWSDTYGELPRSEYSIVYRFDVDGSGSFSEPHGCSFEVSG